MEDLSELNLDVGKTNELNEFISKRIQSESDKVRTEYSAKMAELEKYKPKELTNEQKELQATKQELADLKFKKSLSDIGVSDDLGKYLKSDIDIDEFKKFYEGVKSRTQENKDFQPTTHAKDEGISKEQFAKMDYSKRAKLYTENPTLYAQLSK